MKKLFTLSAAIACSLGSYAQQAPKQLNPFMSKAQAQPADRTPAKTTGADSRPIAFVSLTYGTSSFEVDDSTTVSYTGNNGWDYATGDWKIDSSKSWMYNQSTSQWENRGRSYTQLANNRIMSSLYQELDGGVWKDQQKTSYTYAANGLIATQQFDEGFSGPIMPASLMTNTYNNDMQITENLQQSWNSGTSQWVNSGRTINHYNAAKENDTTWTQSWSQASSQWMNQMRNIMSYTGGHHTATLQQVFNGGVWRDAYRASMTLNAKGQPVVIESEEWDVSTSTWDKSYKTEITYDNKGNVVEEKSSYWDNGAWVYNTKTNYTYNQFNRPLVEETQSWDATTSQWIYDSGNDYQGRYYYEAYTNDIKNVTANLAEMNIFPMPAKTEIVISASFRQVQPVTITILDMNGRVVKQLADQAGAQYRKRIDVTDIPAGNYILNLTGTAEIATKTITVSH